VGLNYQFWGQYFRNVFAAETDTLVEALETRLLPAFTDVEQEAEQKAEEEWQTLCSLPATEDADLFDAAEQASEAGVRYYQLMIGVQQGLINLFAVALYHLYEQQLMFFHRKEVLHPVEESNPKLLCLKELMKRLLTEYCIDITEFPSWPSIQELRLLANTVKHGDGLSGAVCPSGFRGIPSSSTLVIHWGVQAAHGRRCLRLGRAYQTVRRNR